MGRKKYLDCIHFKVLSNNLILYLPTYLFELRYHAKLPPNIIRDRQINSPSKRVDDVPLINNHIKPSQYSQRVMADGASLSYPHPIPATLWHQSCISSKQPKTYATAREIHLYLQFIRSGMHRKENQVKLHENVNHQHASSV